MDYVDIENPGDAVSLLHSPDAIGLGETVSKTEDPAAIHFRSTVERLQDGRYQVELPLKKDLDSLEIHNNFGLARSQLTSLLRSLPVDKKTSLFKLLGQYESMGILEEAPRASLETRQFYLPWFSVDKPGSHTTKQRPVFDAKAKAADGQCLNDLLYTGPPLTPDLLGILLRFRTSPHVVICDITKAFLQVGVKPEHRDLLRILVPHDVEQTDARAFRILRFTRIVMGLTSSPFDLNAVLRHHYDNCLMDTNRPPEVSSTLLQQLKANTFVDNVMATFSDASQLPETVKALQWIYESACMPLQEWASDLPDIRKLVPADLCNPDHCISVLGLGWDIEADSTFVRLAKLDKYASLEPTRRHVLAAASSIFDVDGRLTPATIRLRLLLQDTWAYKHLGWDDRLPDDLQKRWDALIGDIRKCRRLSLPRRVIVQPVYPVQLIAFSDASKHAFGTVVYLRQETTEGDASLAFLLAKARIAPTGRKSCTIPRLELIALVMASKLVTWITGQLTLDMRPPVFFTDSQVALHWILSKKRLRPFEQRRADLVHQAGHTDVNYIPTRLNPADALTRGITVKQLVASCYYDGPPFLLTSRHEWPRHEIATVPPELELGDESPRRNTKLSACLLLPAEPETLTSPFGIDVKRYNSMEKLLRVTAYCLRFINGARKQTVPKDVIVQPDELERAKFLWLKRTQEQGFATDMRHLQQGKLTQLCRQLDLFIDGNLLRVGGRLANMASSKSAKHPVVIPRNADFTRLLITATHERLFHAGPRHVLAALRQEVWIPHGLPVVKATLRCCSLCRLVAGKGFRKPQMAPLPSDRVNVSKPFTNVGFDYFGPINVLEPISRNVCKVWVGLFTCASTRAIHMETVDTCGVESCIWAIERFIARRGLSGGILRSDNGRYFIASKATLEALFGLPAVRPGLPDRIKAYLASEGYNWITYVERAPHCGGFIERLVGLVKRHLRRALWHRPVSLEQFRTILCRIEAIVNDRPLFHPSSDPRDTLPLRPSDFLHPHLHSDIPCLGDLGESLNFESRVSS